MGGIKKKKAKRGIEHHKRSLEETLEAPETYGVRVSEALCKRCDILSHICPTFAADMCYPFCLRRRRQGPQKDEKQLPQQQQMRPQRTKR